MAFPSPLSGSSASSSSFPPVVFTLAAFLISALILHLGRRSKSKSLNLPPGPPGWPIVGNLLQFARSGKQFIHYVRDLQPIYGPIFTLRMGSRTLIIISSNELAHEALIDRGQIFATRPRENPTRAVFSCNKFTVNAALHGPVWRSLRRNMVYNMLSNTRLREFQDVRAGAMDKLIDRLRTEFESTEGSVWVLRNVRFAVFCILLEMCFGVDMDEGTIENVDGLMKRVLIVLNPRLDDYLPLLSPLFAKQRKEAMEVRDVQIQTLVPLIEQRRSELRDPSPDKKSRSFAYLDTLFDIKIEGRKSAPSHAELVTLCSEFLNGGTDTTATAVEWGIARLIENPEIQSKLYSEIVSVVGDRTVTGKDVEQLPYLNAFTKELLRKHPPTYFSLTHAVVEPTKLGGYDIPTDANVDLYLKPMAENPKCWTDPARFRPERFLCGEEADITGATEVKMIPFGAGRRICPGLAMGMLHINLMLGRMVQEFEWLAHPSQDPVSFDEKLEFTVVMKNTLRAVIRPRKGLADDAIKAEK
ncbi:cytochrome P450 77A2-like [Aristolochia californica]|uniref:cytochrome P450 77A2-like n=1 Tax=Aristolochia californica TaxID=171875 RepID=UPI0035D610A7